MINVMEGFGNSFEVESQDLLVPETKEIAPLGDVDALRHAHKLGQLQFEDFVRGQLVKRPRPLEHTIHINRWH